MLAILLLMPLGARDYMLTRNLPSGALDADYSADTVLVRLLLVRYVIMVPCLLLFVFFTYSKWFRADGPVQQMSVCLALLVLGSGFVAISVLGGKPGFGMTALLLVVTYNAALLRFPLRFLLNVLFVLAYTLATYFIRLPNTCMGEFVTVNNTASSGTASAASESTAVYAICSLELTWSVTAQHGMYLIVFLVGAGMPVLAEAFLLRVNHMRMERLRSQQLLLKDEQARSNDLLLRLLPASVVHQVSE